MALSVRAKPRLTSGGQAATARQKDFLCKAKRNRENCGLNSFYRFVTGTGTLCVASGTGTTSSFAEGVHLVPASFEYPNSELVNAATATSLRSPVGIAPTFQTIFAVFSTPGAMRLSLSEEL